MELNYACCRGKNFKTKIGSYGEKYIVLNEINSFLHIPIIASQNSLYEITVKAKKESGNGIIYFNIYGGENFNFKQEKIYCKSEEWLIYKCNLEIKSFPKTLPLNFRIWRGTDGTGAVGIQTIEVSNITGTVEDTIMIIEKQEEKIDVHKSIDLCEKFSKFIDRVPKNNSQKVLVFHYRPEKDSSVNEDAYLTAFNRCGFDVVGFAYSLCSFEFGKETSGKQALKLLGEINPDWLYMNLSFNERIFPFDYVKKIKNEFPNVFISNWTPDVLNYPHPYFINIGKIIQKPLIPSEGQLKLYRDAGCKNVDYFQTGYDQKYFYRKSEEERKELREKYNHDIVFCASNPRNYAYPDIKLRESIILEMHNKYKNEFSVYGYFWEKLNLCNSWKGVLNFYEQNDVYNGSKIVLSVSCYNDVRKYFSNRLPIALAAGTMVMSKYFPGIEEYFENHKHLVWFNTKEECLYLIDYYLKHDEEREQIGINGAQEALLRHTFDYRINELAYRLGFKNIL
jgi:hypothetical protein